MTITGKIKVDGVEHVFESIFFTENIKKNTQKNTLHYPRNLIIIFLNKNFSRPPFKNVCLSVHLSIRSPSIHIYIHLYVYY